MILEGGWSATLTNRGWLKKTQGWTALKSRGSSLAVGIYLQRGSAPPPPPPGPGSMLAGLGVVDAPRTDQRPYQKARQEIKETALWRRGRSGHGVEIVGEDAFVM